METKEFKYKIGDVIKYYGNYSFHNDLLIIDMSRKKEWGNETINIYLCETKEYERFWYSEEYLDTIQIRNVDKDNIDETGNTNYEYNVGDKLIYVEKVWNPFDDDCDQYEHEVVVKGRKVMPPEHDIYLPGSCYKDGNMYLCEFIGFTDENNSRIWISESDLGKCYCDDEEK